MSRTLFIAVSPGEIWAALAEDDALEALRVLRTGAPSQVGAVYLGRVVALRPELPAALVDVGLDRPGFLDARDADKRSGIAGLTEGQALIVEVIKDARADKAAGLRIVRATGELGASIAAAASAARPPARLEALDPPLMALVASFLKPPPDRVVIDDRASFAEARGFLMQRHPELVARLALHAEATPLFEQAGLAGAIDEVLSRRVSLPSGGALIIEPTHAATIIDVDSGQATALATNLEAARVLARQIILRNLAGPIVVDFVGMKKRQDRDTVLASLKSALAADREKPELLGWTRLGHVELVRRRRQAPLAEILYERAPDGSLRKTAVTIALDALRTAEGEARARAGKAITLAAHPDIVAVLNEGEGLAARQMLEARLGQALVLAPQPQRPRESFDIRPR